jgi:hypothetical protein
MFFPTSAGSMSMWTILAWGAKCSALPVERSPKRVATPMITSASVMAVLAAMRPW